jgi:uncharacterized protein (TIRG00374 family)
VKDVRGRKAVSADGEPPRPSQAPRRERWVRRWLPWTTRRAVELLVLALIIEYLILPQLAGTRRWLSLIADVNLWWVLAGLGGELASLFAFSLATRVLLPRGPGRLSLFKLWRIDLTGIALSHAVPGGAAAGTAIGYRLLYRNGVDAAAASFAKLGQGAVSALVLQAFLLSSIAIAIPLHGNSPLYLTATVAGGVVLLALAALTALVLRAEDAVAKAAGVVIRVLPRLHAETGSRFVHELAKHIRAVAREPRLFLASAGWSAANWLLDAFALWCSIVAFGHVLGYDGLLVPFCVANTAAWIPLTPSGLGIVEGVIVPTLIGFGTPHGIALLGTITWRLLNFWLPIPLGAVSYFTVRGDHLGAAAAVDSLARPPGPDGDPPPQPPGESPSSPA